MKSGASGPGLSIMRVKGVCYDAGREMMGRNWRPEFDAKVVRRELEIIKKDLHCNAVRIQGRDVQRLRIASEYALEMGLDVWFSPELWDRSQRDTLEYLVRAAAPAEELRRRFPDRVVFSVGSEISLFNRGFLPGRNVLKRLNHKSFSEAVRSGRLNASINEYLARAAAGVRGVFRGPLTYASVLFEKVDWRPFDFAGADVYRGGPTPYPARLNQYTSLGKPFANTEFGCCTFRGAGEKGGRGWQIVDWRHRTPRLTGDYVYDQTAQARELADLLRSNDEAGVDATFVFTFADYTATARTKRQLRVLERMNFDPDIAHYSLVKTFPDGRHGTKYPDLPWEPKESFYAVAEYYGSH